MQSRSEQSGLFYLYVPGSKASEALQYVSDVDIIAVHGFQSAFEAYKPELILIEQGSRDGGRGTI